MKYLDRAGEPIDSLSWAKLIRSPAYSIVKLTRQKLAPTIVTSWVGIVSEEEAAPKIFLTEAYSEEGNDKSRRKPFGDQHWCNTEEQALAQHEAIEKELHAAGHKSKVTK
jgi:hypothetical protein